MIDTRFPPRPRFIDVPLYPTKEVPIFDESGVEGHDLNNALAQRFGTPAEQSIVGDSASSLLKEYFIQAKTPDETNKVAIPTFSCQSLVDAVLDAGEIPVFYDLNYQVSVTEAAADFAIESKCDTFIWPTFFGSRPRNPVITQMLKQANIGIVFDEAQANLFGAESSNLRSYLDEKDIVLYSFGWSKALASSGGGALFGDVHNNPALARLQWYVENQPVTTFDSGRHVRDALLARASRFAPDFPQSYGFVPTGYDRLDTLLEARHHEGDHSVKITSQHAVHALSRLDSFNDEQVAHLERFEIVQEALRRSLGEQSMALIEEVESAPTILAVCTKPDTRYKVMAYMASKGVQTTWYYYPLSRVSRYMGYGLQSDTGSLAIAESIVILPFQASHTAQQCDTLIDAINDIPRNLR